MELVGRSQEVTEVSFGSPTAGELDKTSRCAQCANEQQDETRQPTAVVCDTSGTLCRQPMYVRAAHWVRSKVTCCTSMQCTGMWFSPVA